MIRRFLTLALCWLSLVSAASAACCYFAALNKDVNQPGQRAFITWDEQARVESFTVQPTFEGNAADFGMVIPTPARPKLQEMPKDFFKALAVFTILDPIDWSRFRQPAYPKSASSLEASGGGRVQSRAPVRVLEAGIVGSLDYKVLEADKATALFDWLKQNHYVYSGDTQTLDHYVQKKWTFTVMKIDPRQMKKKADGGYLGEVTPTRFTFATPKPIYPLRITQISVKDQTDVLLYVLASRKMDLAGKWSYENNFLSMWSAAMTLAIPEKLTAAEKRWIPVVGKLKLSTVSAGPGASLEWAGRLTHERIQVLTGEKPYTRQAPPEEIKKLRILRGHLREGRYLTKFRKVFAKAEMTDDIALVPARIGQEADDLDYTALLPNPSGMAPP